jgi:8-hydroxy-5-deazaflavin:NADPH oxidoreductase
VTVSSRDPERARKVAATAGAARGAGYAAAAADAEVVVLTVPWPAMDDTLDQLGELDGTVVVDVSFPSRKQEREALKGSSTAEEVQRRLPRARVVKGWNHVHAPHLTAPEVDGSPPRSCSPATTRRPSRPCPLWPGTWASTPSTSVP